MIRLNYEKGLRLLLGFVFVVFVYSVLMAHIQLRELRMKIDNKEYKEQIDEKNAHVESFRQKIRQNQKNSYIYPKRNNMGECYPRYGNVTVFVMHAAESMKTHYGMAQSTLHCYLKGANYTYISVNTDFDPRTVEKCSQNKEINFRKHCAVAVYLEDNPLIDWMLVLDADTAIVNPNHCIEEYIDDRVDVILYERFFNFEIAVGNYLVKNTPYGRQFAMDLANFEFRKPQVGFGNSENGVLHMLVMEKVLGETAKPEIDMCNRIWLQSKDYDTYMAFVQCTKIVLGANRFWPGKIRIHRRGHSFVRDGHLTTDKFCSADFMFHGWKAQNVDILGWKSTFTRILNPAECGQGLSGWPYRPDYNVTVEQIRDMFKGHERSGISGYPQAGRKIPWLTVGDVSACFPHCENGINEYNLVF